LLDRLAEGISDTVAEIKKPFAYWRALLAECAIVILHQETEKSVLQRRIDLECDSYARDAIEAEIKQRREAEHALGAAYLRLRHIIPGALDTPHAPTREQVWDTTERAAERLRSLNAELIEALEDLMGPDDDDDLHDVTTAWDKGRAVLARVNDGGDKP